MDRFCFLGRANFIDLYEAKDSPFLHAKPQYRTVIKRNSQSLKIELKAWIL